MSENINSSNNLKNIKLSSNEINFRYNNNLSILLKNFDVSFHDALQLKIRRSTFGKFINTFNDQQTQNRYFNTNKLGTVSWIIKELTKIERQLLDENNNVCDEFFELLRNTVAENECLTWNILYKKLTCLRLENYHITIIDGSVSLFKNLNFLFLGGNHIKSIPAHFLPRKLVFLELFGNKITDFADLSKNPPLELLHMGLGRNALTDLSNFYVFEKCSQLNKIRSLDLSDNDIYDLVDVLEPLRSLPHLKSLQLEGNPCYTCVSYKNAILTYLPNLAYLDNTQICNNDKHACNFVKNDLNKATVTFTCHRIIGLEAPPKEKDVIHNFYLEVYFPLLEERRFESTTSIDYNRHSINNYDNKKNINFPIQSVYNAEDEYEREQRLNIINTSFKTDRQPWSKIIQFPENALKIDSPENDLIAIRDTFRSKVNVRVVYLKVSIPKGKQTKEDTSLQPPQETILKKITLASFYCDLYNINWSDETIDFYWNAQLQPNTSALPVEGSLRAINYIEGKKPKTAGKKGQEDLEKVPSKEYLPDVFTVQVGFGLVRSHNN